MSLTAVTNPELNKFKGPLVLQDKTETIPTLASNGTIATSGVARARVTTGGAVTGAILQAGTIDGQMVVVQNHSANTITMAAKATSNVQSGVTNVIVANGAATYIWDDELATWICCGMGL